jgi:hypothetical protein
MVGDFSLQISFFFSFAQYEEIPARFSKKKKPAEVQMGQMFISAYFSSK